MIRSELLCYEILARLKEVEKNNKWNAEQKIEKINEYQKKYYKKLKMLNS